MSKLILRGGTAVTSVPTLVLAAGEPAAEYDTGKIKVGDGVRQWSALPYVGTALSTTNVGAALDVLRKNAANTALEWAAPAAGGGGGVPAAHASTHASGGTDAVTLAQAQITGLPTALTDRVLTTDARLTDQRTPLNASVTIAKVSTGNVGAALEVLRKNAANTGLEWAAPAAGTGGSAASTTFSPNGTIVSTDVQSAVTEVAGDASTALGTHEGATTGIHGITDTAGLLLKSGGTMTGLLTLSGAPTVALHAATKAYVDAGGGTGISPTIVDAAGDIIVATGPDAVARLARGAAGNVLQTNSAGTNIEWAAPTAGGGSGIPATIVDAPGDLIVASAADTVVRLARGTAGQVLKTNAAGTNIEWGTDATGGGSSNVTTARRTTDGTAIVSSVVVVDDPVLTLAVAANTTYILDGYIRYDTVGAADIRLRLNTPAGATGTWASTDDGLSHPEYLWGTEVFLATGITGVCLVRGILMVGATAGSLVLGHAQGASSPSGTKLVAGSYIRLESIA